MKNDINEPGKQNTAKEGGGATGYDAEREQTEVNKEREEMSKERDPGQLEEESKTGKLKE